MERLDRFTTSHGMCGLRIRPRHNRGGLHDPRISSARRLASLPSPYRPMSNITFHAAEKGTNDYLIIGSTQTQTAVLVGNLTAFPGSAQLMVSHGLWVYPAARGRGYSVSYDRWMRNFVRELGFRTVVASVHINNEIQHQRLTRLGWKRISKTLWMVKA